MRHNRESNIIREAISTPFIIGMVIPLLFFDLSVELYHRVCFKLYKLDYVNRNSYIKIDRHKLSKLGLMQKFFCVYCGYANGLLPYTAKIAAETEKYWCGIKHEADPDFIEPEHHKSFAEREEYK